MRKLSAPNISDIINTIWEVMLFAQNCCAMRMVALSIFDDSKNSWFHLPARVELPGSKHNNSFTPHDAYPADSAS